MQYVDLGKLPYHGAKKSKKKRIFKWGLLTLVLAFILYSGYILYWPALTLIKQIAKQPQSVFSLITNPGGQVKSTDGKTNYLLVGIDKREDENYSVTSRNGQVTKNSFRTDSIMVISIGKETKNISMVSIPRDLWVKIPGFEKVRDSSGKINSVYEIGEINNYPGGGLAYLSQKVQDILGIPIHYSARLDFSGFKKGIDILGGVDIKVEKSFDDYRYPIEGKEDAKCTKGTDACRYKHLRFDKGITHMDGETALEFSRSREGTNGEGSDFARARRQQKILLAARDKALKVENLFDPVKLNKFFEDFGQSIETDLDISALVGTYNLGKELKVDNVNTLVLDSSPEGLLYSPPADDYGGAFTLLPQGNNFNKIHDSVQKLLKP